MAGRKKSSGGCSYGKALACILLLVAMPMIYYQYQLHFRYQQEQEHDNDFLQRSPAHAAVADTVAKLASRDKVQVPPRPAVAKADAVGPPAAERALRSSGSQGGNLPAAERALRGSWREARRSSESGQSGARPEPDLDGLVAKISEAMRQYQRSYRATLAGESASIPPECERGWALPEPGHFLPGCPEKGCEAFESLELAQAACLSTPECGGITETEGRFEIRKGSTLYASSAGETAWIRETCFKRATAEGVWHTFREAMETAMKDPSLHLDTDFGPARDDDSIFISISAYRDVSCRATVRKAYERAAHPERLNVGVVQQNCNAHCQQGVGWANTRHLEPSPPDPDCIAEFCAGPLGKPHCDAGRVRILRIGEAEALGPLYARYLNAKLWRGETFFMQIDAHTDFRAQWDTMAIEQIKRTPSYPTSVITNYPPPGKAERSENWGPPDPSESGKGGLCGLTFERVAEGDAPFTIRLAHTGGFESMDGASSESVPPYTGFIAAGFFFAHGSIVAAAPPDPFLPYIFMGEEIAITLRAWTSGFDMYAPSVDYVAHEYVRQHSIKFWESVGIVFDAPDLHNKLTTLIMPRIQHLVGFPEAIRRDQVQPQDLLTQLEDFGVGTVRTREDFLRIHQIDLANKRQATPQWCMKGQPSEMARENMPDWK